MRFPGVRDAGSLLAMQKPQQPDLENVVSADIPGKNEAATAAALNPTPSVAGPDEASTGAAVSQSTVTEPLGSASP